MTRSAASSFSLQEFVRAQHLRDDVEILNVVDAEQNDRIVAGDAEPPKPGLRACALEIVSDEERSRGSP